MGIFVNIKMVFFTQEPVSFVVSLVLKNSFFPSLRDFVKWNALKNTRLRILRKEKQTELHPRKKGM